jgi:DNA-binding CsgD family transcriptional regulator
VSVLRPDLSFPVPLSRAEAAVVRELVAGRSHAQISDSRATSPRTVANQLATVFKKFGVSGRGAIVHQLIQHSLERQRGASGAAELRA